MRIIAKIFFISTLIYFSCENNPTTYEDCNGVPNGPSNEDNCGACDNNPLNDCIQDCNGVWGGNATIDDCGVCDDNPLNDGVPSCIDPSDCVIPDQYGSYNSEGMDCLGVCGGIAIKDECGRCNGEGSVYVCGCEKLPDGEPFVDLNENGYWDRGEIGDEDNFIDFNNNSVFDPPEEYEDLNNNGIYDPPACDCYGNVRDCWYDANGDGIQTFNDNEDPDEPGNECPFEYNPIYRCIDINNSENIGVDCDPSNPNECPENFECIQSWVESINTDYTGSIYDDCGNCILPDEANFFRCSNGDSCNPKDENVCKGELACSSEFIEGYSGQAIEGDCLLRANNLQNSIGDCDCEDVGNNTYNYYGTCGGPDISSDDYDCDYNCIATGTGLDENGKDECGICAGVGVLGSGDDALCACTDLEMNSIALVKDPTDTNLLYLLYKINNDGLAGAEIDLDGNLNITNISGGDMQTSGWIIQYDGTKILAFSFTNATLDLNKIDSNGDPYGCGLLSEIRVDDSSNLVGIKEITFPNLQYIEELIYSYRDLVILDSFVNENLDCLFINPYSCIDEDENGICEEGIVSWNGEYNGINQFLGKITSLSFEGTGSTCSISSIPENIVNLNQLQNLDLSNNNLSNLGSHIGNITKLTRLNLSNNYLSALPDEISDLNNLYALDLSSNQFTDFPSSLLSIPFGHNISSVDLSDNQITSIPDDICSYNIGSANIDISSNVICQENEVINNSECLIFNDADEDKIPDECDICPLDPLNDADNDAVCGDVDICEGFDDAIDIDSDTVPDGCDICEGFDDLIDTDNDTIPDGCDTD